MILESEEREGRALSKIGCDDDDATAAASLIKISPFLLGFPAAEVNLFNDVAGKERGEGGEF